MAGKLDEPDMEEGEIVDSEEETTVQENVPDLVSSASVRRDPDLVAEAKPPLAVVIPAATYRQAATPNYSDEDSDEGDSEDSEHEGNSSPQKAKRMSFGGSASNYSDSLFVNPLLNQKPGLNTGANIWGMDMSKAPTQKRANNIWGSVLQEQTIEREVSSFGVEKPDDLIGDRDVESYNYMNAKNDTRLLEPSSGSEMDSGPEDVCPDITDKESFALEPAKKRVSAKARLDKKKKNWDRSLNEIIRDNMEEEASAEDSDFNGKESEMEHSSRQAHKRTMKDRLGEREQSRRVKDRLDKKHVKFRIGEQTVREKFIEVTPDDSTAKIVNAIVENLYEHNVDLVRRIVENVGNSKAIELMYATENVENQGGMMTMNGGRRRTPGGVFIQLLKSDCDVTKEQVNSIFREEKKQWNRRIKELKKVRGLKKMQKCRAALESDIAWPDVSKEIESGGGMDTECMMENSRASVRERLGPRIHEAEKHVEKERSLNEDKKDESLEDVDLEADVDIQLE